ncbi:organic cation transporter protein [Patella vulgata]|uniref:organic cation transporter protein n=1 Tax=Patella vulgata TaxID=6465 RepID=UPI00217FA47E|nr:organic cation transporter protein [Patella vulgata]
MKFDDILEHLGDFGPYQKRLYLLVCLPSIIIACQVLLPVFILDIPAHRCAVPSLSNDTYAIQGTWHQDLINQSIPSSKDGWSKCNVYSYNKDGNRTEVGCNKWVYDRSQYESTFISEVDMICDRAFYRSLANMILFGGNLVGALGLGLVSDIIGRKKTLLISIVLWTGTGIGTAFSTDFISFATLRFFTGLAMSGIFMTSFVIGLELVGPSKRTIAGMVIMVFWAIGLFVLTICAYLIRNWKTLTLVTSVPAIFFLSYWWLIPESARWLLSKGRNEEAEEIIRKAAKVNNTELPPKLFDKSTLDDGPKAKIWQLFTTPSLLFRTLIIFFNWFVVSMVYYGLGLNVSNLSGDSYLNFTIANIAETVSYALCILLLDRLGRKVLHCSAMLLGGIACLATMFPVIYGDKSHEWLTTTLSMIGKLGASGAFAIIYVFAGELFPTILRNSALGASSTCARVGGMISPYIADLGLLVGGELKTALPLIVFGSASVAAGLLSLFLPETLNRKLPDTIDDAKQFTSGKKSGRDYELNQSNDDDKPLEKYTPATISDGKV